MRLYVTEISKYVIALFMLLYVTDSFWALTKQYEEDRKMICTRQIIYMFAIQISCYIQILARTGKVAILFFLLFQIVIYASVLMLFYILYPDGNRIVINNTCMLLIIGMSMLTRLSYEKAVKQFIVMSLSFIIGFFVPELVFRLNVLKKYTWLYAAVAIGAIAIVLVLGTATKGAKISYKIAGVTFQPSEFAKILFLFFLAGALYKAKDITDLFKIAATAGAHVIILVLSKDLGSALLFFVVFLTLLYISTNNILYLAGGLGFGAFASVFAYKLFPHVQVRVNAWKDPFKDIGGAGYQVSQSLFGISSGGAFGLGLGGGAPQSIPIVEQDFIFSAIAEELGLIFAVLMTLICLSTFMHMMYEGFMLRDKFYRLIACGIGIAYIFQTFLTIGGGAKFIPLTGVTLPLVSYGGSSVMVSVIMIMIFEGICMIRRYEEDEEAIKREQERENRRDNRRGGRRDDRRGGRRDDRYDDYDDYGRDDRRNDRRGNSRGYRDKERDLGYEDEEW